MGGVGLTAGGRQKMQKAEGIENGKLKMENLGVPPARVLKKIPKSKKEQKVDFKGFKGFKGLKLDAGQKMQRARGILCQTKRRVRSLPIANEELAY